MKQVEFDAQGLGVLLSELTTEQLDKLDFGVIGFDDESLVNVYNACESRMAGLSTQNVLGADLFNTVAPCMNNFLVAQKFQGCCSNANNFLRYGVTTTESCYSNFEKIVAKFGLDASVIVPNINWFMSVPVMGDGSAGVATAAVRPGSHVSLRAERDVLAVLSNCPQMHNPCNGYNPTPIRVVVSRSRS